ncbi:MAG: EboA domain-containing protein [Rhodospirillales bacterium]|nr:EboA domain-containing protein [Rhodospirillales bacterium]
MGDTPSTLLRNWITRQAPPPAADWFDGQIDKLLGDPAQKTFDIAFGMAPRKLGKDDLVLSAEDLAAADAARSGWNPAQWSIDVAARVCFLIALSKDPSQPFAARFKDLHRTADLGELLALFSGLSLYAAPETLVDLAAGGLRTNIKAEFEAVAHRNPFPAEQFAINPWNNMVLKALFVGVLLEPIQGLDERANPELARILSDYAHERWAADRLVSPELWRCIGPFAGDEYLDDFRRVVAHGKPTEKKAVALALTTAPPSAGKDELCAALSAYAEMIASGALTWRAIADEMLDNSLAITRKLNFEVEMTR